MKVNNNRRKVVIKKYESIIKPKVVIKEKTSKREVAIEERQGSNPVAREMRMRVSSETSDSSRLPR